MSDDDLVASRCTFSLDEERIFFGSNRYAVIVRGRLGLLVVHGPVVGLGGPKTIQVHVDFRQADELARAKRATHECQALIEALFA